MAQFASVSCITVTSSGFGVSGNKVVKCGDAGAAFSNYIMTGCGWWSPWMNTATSEIVGTGPEERECRATTTTATGLVQAVAQCCDIGAYVSCDQVQTTGGSLTTAVCPAGYSNVVGCVSSGEACAQDTTCDIAWSNGNQPITSQQCTGHEQLNSGGSADVQSVCCQLITETAKMECHQIVGQPTGPANDDSSEISCKETLGSEWFLTSCDEYVRTDATAPQLDGHFALVSGSPANDVCMVRNSGFNGVTIPIAQCCRIGIFYIVLLFQRCLLIILGMFIYIYSD